MRVFKSRRDVLYDTSTPRIPFYPLFPRPAIDEDVGEGGVSDARRMRAYFRYPFEGAHKQKIHVLVSSSVRRKRTKAHRLTVCVRFRSWTNEDGDERRVTPVKVLINRKN